MRRHVLALVATVAVGTGACVFGPTVTCQDVSDEVCDRAVEMAKPLVRSYWMTADEVLVHPGVCTRDMECSARQASFPGFVTVELSSDQPEAASVVIDMTEAEWTASCRLIVPDDSGAHGEACSTQ
jgi:hypothetical protein